MKKTNLQHILPSALEVEQGKCYTWCSCGETNTPPLCDKTNCGKKALLYKADLTETLYFCNCKQTKTPPLCDGSHANLLLAWAKNKGTKAS